MFESTKLIKFANFAARKLGIKKLPKINFVGNTEDTMRAFGHFIGDKKESRKDSITVRTKGRHPIDVMRTIAHELVHYKQIGSNKTERMKEDEANAMAGRIMRDYDSLNPKEFKDKPIKEDSAVPVNSMGTSSSIAGSGGIDTFDPMLSKNKMFNRLPKKSRKLRDILSKETNNEKKEDGK
jgi:hypothetical protein